jgi:hypothetical protein
MRPTHNQHNHYNPLTDLPALIAEFNPAVLSRKSQFRKRTASLEHTTLLSIVSSPQYTETTRTRQPPPDQSPPAPKKQPKTVGFFQDPASGEVLKEFIESNSIEEDIKLLWWSRAEIRQMHRHAGQVLNELREQNPSYIQSMSRLFQECSTESNVPDVVSANCDLLLNSPREDIRGLERQMDKRLSQYRLVHVRNILKFQRHITKLDLRDPLLRTTSKKTSRVSLAMARVLAHGDSSKVVSMIREELDSSRKKGYLNR